MRFFEYDDTFVPWLRSIAGRRPIIDVGCGEGFLVRDLNAAGARVVGVDFRDLFEPDVAPLCLLADATTCPVVQASGVLLVLARPCHGPWISQVLRMANSEALYIGRESRMRADLDDGPEGEWKTRDGRIEQVQAPGIRPALDDEPIEVWRITPRHRTEKDAWFLVEQDGGSGVNWQRRVDRRGPHGKPWTAGDEPGFWVNAQGAGMAVLPSDRIVEGPLYVGDERELDWTRATWVQGLMETAAAETYPTGWLAPTGVFHSCEYHRHDLFAFYCLGFEVRELELLGWARVHQNDDFTPPIFASVRTDDGMPTDAQLATVDRLTAKFARVSP